MRKGGGRNKGKVGEREWRDVLRSMGYADARRGQQYAGGADSPDVVGGIPGTHAEVKRVERLVIDDAIAQAVAECGASVPYVAHRRNRGEWLVTIRARDVEAFARAVTGTGT